MGKKKQAIKKKAEERKKQHAAGKGMGALSKAEKELEHERHSKELDPIWQKGAEEYKAKKGKVCTCRKPKAFAGKCERCKLPLEGEEDMFGESIEMLRTVFFESTSPTAPEAKDQRLLIANKIMEAKKRLDENVLAVFADDESIDKVIDTIVNAMGEQGELAPAGAIETMVGDMAGDVGDEGPGAADLPIPDEGPGEGPAAEGPPEEFQFGAGEEEEEAGEEMEEAGEEEEEAGEEEEEEATED
jgi:hypothetical protein